MHKISTSAALLVASLAIPVAAMAGSQPTSTRASNITPSDTHSTVAPALPDPPVSPDAPPEALLQAARTSLARGQTGQAQQALEMAETRLLDRSVPADRPDAPVADPLVGKIADARHALGDGQREQAMQILDSAISRTQSNGSMTRD